MAGNAETFAYTFTGPYESTQQFIDNFINPIEEDEYSFTYAIIDKTKPPSTEDRDGELVGRISFVDANPVDRSVEIGHVRTFPPYVGTGVATAATKLLLDYAFASPETGGLGLCRVEWHSSTANLASIVVAEKLGFEKIGVVRYQRLFSKGNTRGKFGNGRSLPPGCHEDDLWRDLAMYAMYWDNYLEREG
jgi:RimJ/RimL family protein N-acetyltransferase